MFDLPCRSDELLISIFVKIKWTFSDPDYAANSTTEALTGTFGVKCVRLKTLCEVL